jgi:hypothetical protein
MAPTGGWPSQSAANGRWHGSKVTVATKNEPFHVRSIERMARPCWKVRKMDGMAGHLETGELAALLGVTVRQLDNDQRAGFLYPREIVHPADGRVQVGLWSPFAVRRAKRLYRLRRLGAKGPRLRILLFLADGWGWDGVRDQCLTGLERICASSLNGVRRYAKGGEVGAFDVDAIREHQHEALIRSVGEEGEMRPTSAETTRFYVGMLRGGVPLEGGSVKRVMDPLVRLLRPDLGKARRRTWTWLAEVISGMLGLRADRLVSLAREADNDHVERARMLFRQSVRLLRGALRRNAGSAERGTSFSLLTLCGHAARIDPVEFAKNPAGVTGAQALGGAFALSLAIDVAFKKAAGTAIAILTGLFRAR